MVRQEPGAASSVERFFQFSLLGLVASGFLAVAGSGYLDAPTIVFTCAGLLLRGVLLATGLRWRPSRRVVARLLLAYGVFFLADWLAISQRAAPAVVHLAFFLAVILVAAAAHRRGHLAMAAISFAGLAAAAFLSLSSGFLAALVLYVGFAAAVLISAEIGRSLGKATAAARWGTRGLGVPLAAVAAGLALGILGLTAGLFLLSPHAAGPALGSRLFHRVALPGFSRRIVLGEIAGFQTRYRTAMHVRLYASEPPGGLKWRGGGLTEFDGREWSNPEAPETRLYADQGRLDLVPTAYRRPGRRIVYDVFLDAIDSDALFFTGTPEHVDVRTPYILRTGASSFRLQGRPPRGSVTKPTVCWKTRPRIHRRSIRRPCWIRPSAAAACNFPNWTAGSANWPAASQPGRKPTCRRPTQWRIACKPVTGTPWISPAANRPIH